MPKTVTAAVYLNATGQPVIFPPVIVAAKSDDIDIVNVSGGDIVVMYPDNVFKNPGGFLKKHADVAEHTQKAQKKVDAGATSGSHPFKVFCYQTDSFAQANSDPVFIIE